MGYETMEDQAETAPPEAAAAELTTLTEEQKKFRAENIGSSEIACLFGCGRKTPFELFLEKTGQVQADDLSGLDWIEGGIFLEPGIARWYAHKTGNRVQKVHRYTKHPKIKGWGANLDYEIIGHARGAAPLEIKNVNFFIHKRMWSQGEDEEGDGGEAPLHIELQLQHQIGATGRNWGAIAACVGGSQLRFIERDRHQPTIDLIGEKIEEFWDRVRRDDAPDIMGGEDLDALKKLYPRHVEGQFIPVGDNARDEFVAQMLLLHDAKERKAQAEKAEADAQAQLREFITEHEAAVLAEPVEIGGKLFSGVSLKTQQRAEFTMPASSFRVMRFVAHKEAKPKRARGA
jgi:predicted phage-related endonuclease